MTTYVDAIAPIEHAYDAYFVHSRSASAAPLNTAGAGASMPRPVLIRDDLPEYVLELEAETDAPGFAAARQPDTDRLRVWEVAGTAHVDAYGLGPAAIAFLNCPLPVNRGPHHYIVHTAVLELARWLRDRSRQLPHGTPISLDASGAVVRDQYGNALGGIRTPQLDVPVATLSGSGQSGGFCFLFGTTREFSPAELVAAHGDRINYLTKYVAATRAMRRTRFLQASDVVAVLIEAVLVPFPEPAA